MIYSLKTLETNFYRFVYLLIILLGTLFVITISPKSNAYDLSTSCPTIRTVSSTPQEMVVEVTNTCGQCAHISVNYTFNGKYQAFAGTWNNVQPGEAHRMYIPLTLGLGTYQAVVTRVQTCK